MTLIIYFTDCVVTRWDQFISLAIFFDCLRTVIHDCIVGLINWLRRFICDGSFQLITLSILIMNVNISFFIWLNKVIIYIRRWFNCRWNRVVVWEWRITFQLCISNASIWLSYLSFCNNIRITSCDQVPSVVSFTSRSQWRIWSTCKWFVKCFSNLGFVMS